MSWRVKVAGHVGGPQKRSSWRGSAYASHSRSTLTGYSPVTARVRVCAFDTISVIGIDLLLGGCGVGEDVVELAEAGEPQPFELVERSARLGEPLRVAADDAFPALRFLGHESGLLEHGDVLLHGGERHVVAGGERGDRRR